MAEELWVLEVNWDVWKNLERNEFRVSLQSRRTVLSCVELLWSDS